MKVKNLSECITADSVVTLAMVVLPSVALHSLLGVHVKTVFVATTAILLLLGRSSIRHQKFETLIPVLSLIAALTLIAWLWSTLLSQLLLGFSLLTVITLSSLTAKALLNQGSVNFLYKLTVLLLAGAWIGFVYSLAGGGPTYCFANPDLRQNCLYLATFSNSQPGMGLIRPAGIFDEPGALSFFVILVVCLNELCEGGKGKSFALLALGLVTLSVAHVFCFVAYTALTLRTRIAYLALALVVVAGPATNVLGNYLDQESPLDSHFFQRFTIKDGQLSGDNRSGQVTEFFELLDYNISRYGNNPMVKYDRGGVSSRDQSSNPFSIWFGYGLLMWIPYAVTLAVLARNAFTRQRSIQITAVLLVLLLLQRPYIYSLYWGFPIWFVVVLMYNKKGSPGVHGGRMRASLVPRQGGT